MVDPENSPAIADIIKLKTEPSPLPPCIMRYNKDTENPAEIPMGMAVIHLITRIKLFILLANLFSFHTSVHDLQRNYVPILKEFHFDQKRQE